MQEKRKILDFDDDFNILANELDEAYKKKIQYEAIVDENHQLVKEIWQTLEKMPGYTDKFRNDFKDEKNIAIEKANIVLESFDDRKLRGTIQLNESDYIVCIITGIIATLMDIFIVGTPNKINKIDSKGAPFTKMLRKVGNGKDELSKILKILSDKCKVSYDISSMKNVVYPKNHRLRCFAHDPVFGLLFAIFDIKYGTATLIDNNGHIVIIPNSKGMEDTELIMCVVYYIGHILSDVCTLQGIPIPGFTFTQFFSNGSKNSFASICEKMYIDGYDLRHLASMSTPVFVKQLIIEIYYRFFVHENIEVVRSIAEKEIDKNLYDAYKYRLLIIPDAICSAGNILKFFIPPSNGNPTAINLPEWLALLNDGLMNIKYETRDKTIEEIERNREVISNNWRKLLDDIE